MKRYTVLKMMGMTILTVLLLIGRMAGQTPGSTATTGHQTAWQVLNNIIVNANEGNAPLAIYPPEFLDELQALGNSPYPPIPFATSTQTSNKMSGGMHPMDDQQSDPPTYAVIDLGDLGGGYSEAFAINDSSQVVGESSTSSGAYYAFLYSGNLMMGINNHPGTVSSAAFGINKSGQICGLYSLGGTNHVFVYLNGVMQDIGTFPGGAGSGFAQGINNSGQVVGEADTTNSYNRAFLYSNDTMQDLGTLSNDINSIAFGINDAGQVVGISGSSNGETRAFLYTAGYMQDIGNLGGTNGTYARGINISGEIVGSSGLSGDTNSHAFLYANNTMQDLGTLGGYPYSGADGINNGGQVVGTSAHAFLWQNGTMYDLNNLVIITNAGWNLQEATAINDKGQICGYGINPSGQTHAFLLSPVDPNDLPTIQIGKLHPAYGNGIVQQTNTDSLIVITHGAIPPRDDPTVDTAWVDTMSNSITAYLANKGITNWQVEGHKWIVGASLSEFQIAFSPQFQIPGLANVLSNAKMEGINLGNSILASGNWTNFHFIAHSAGAEVIQACSEVIRAKLGNNCTIQCTFLDPYTGFVPDTGILDNPLLNNTSIYGDVANWSDDYFTVDEQTFGNNWPVTQGYLNHAYTVNVTYLDTNKTLLNGYVQVSGIVSESCQKTESTHGWPIQFYMNTITGATNSSYNGFGFPLSEEGGNWASIGLYQVGNSPSQVLGTPDPDCVPLFESNNGLPPSGPINFSNLQGDNLDQVISGLIQKNNAGLGMGADDPAWLASFILVTNPVNFVAFDAQFTSNPQGAGELSVYWDTNAVGFIDESLVGSNVEHYVFTFLPASVNTVHMLGLRLDASTNGSASTISITNVITGYIGVSQPFTLSFTTNTYDGLPVLQLTGEPGFNYTVQASTNLASTNWTDIAILVNSNGVVPFVDPDSVNYTYRFYRAIAPY